MCCLQLVKLSNNGCRYLHPNANIKWISKRLESSQQQQQQQQQEQCKEEEQFIGKCTTKGIAISPCQSYVKKRDKPTDNSPQYSFLMKSMWEKAKCCVTCVQESVPVRHDVLHQEELRHTERRYQRTWPQCPARKLVPKKCIFEKLNIPEMERRPRGQTNPDAKMCLKVHECAQVDKYETPCKPVTCKPKGKCLFSEPKCCQKRCTMYPSYSECCAKKGPPKRPTECGCLSSIGLCLVNDYLRRLAFINEGRK